MRQIYSHDPLVGRRFIPRIKARVPHEGGGYLIQANGLGFRDDFDFEPVATPGKRRILLFGDSFTAGEGVSNGQRYSDFLGGLVPNVEIYNFGMPGTGTDQQYLIYKEFSEGIEHDVVIIGVFVENIRRVAARYRHYFDDDGNKVLFAKPYFTLDEGKLVLHGVPTPKNPIAPEDAPDLDASHVFARSRFPKLKALYERAMQNDKLYELFVGAGLRDQLLRLSGYQPIPEYDDEQSSGWQVMRGILIEWISSHKAPVMVMPIPLYHYVAGISDPSTYQERLREATETAGGTFFDPTDGLSQYSKKDRRSFFFAGDGHLTKQGHQALAGVMSESVSRLLDESAQSPNGSLNQ